MSLTTVVERSRVEISVSSSRATRLPDSEVSATQRQALAHEVIDDGENAEAAAIAEGVGNEVKRPAAVRARRRCDRCARTKSPLAAAAPANDELFFPVDPVQFLVVHHDALAL